MRRLLRLLSTVALCIWDLPPVYLKQQLCTKICCHPRNRPFNNIILRVLTRVHQKKIQQGEQIATFPENLKSTTKMYIKMLLIEIKHPMKVRNPHVSRYKQQYIPQLHSPLSIWLVHSHINQYQPISITITISHFRATSL